MGLLWGMDVCFLGFHAGVNVPFIDLMVGLVVSGFVNKFPNCCLESFHACLHIFFLQPFLIHQWSDILFHILTDKIIANHSWIFNFYLKKWCLLKIMMIKKVFKKFWIIYGNGILIVLYKQFQLINTQIWNFLPLNKHTRKICRISVDNLGTSLSFIALFEWYFWYSLFDKLYTLIGYYSWL